MNISCIGAINWDRKLRLSQALQNGTSNPVHLLAGTAGGVAFNLARQLVRQGCATVRLLSAWGDDPEGQRLQQAARQAGVELLGNARAGLSSGQYTAVLEPNGDLALALADMGVLDDLPESFWLQAEALVRRSDAVVLDMNLCQAGLQRLCQVAQSQRVPLAMVAVSAPKMRHLPADLRGVGLLLLNRDERAVLGPLPPAGSTDNDAVWQALHQRGLGALLVTHGADGVVVCDAMGRTHHAAPQRLQAVDVTGAGDALAATTLHALWVQRQPLQACATLGQRAAATVLLSVDNV